MSAIFLLLGELDTLILRPTFIFGCVALGLLLVRSVIYKVRRSNGENEHALGNDAKYLALTWAMVPCFIVAYSFAGKSILDRLMIPLVPFFILGAIFSAELALRKWKGRYADIILFSMILLVAGGNLYIERRSLSKMIEPTLYRQVGDVLGGKVNDKHRLLITPSIVSRRGDGFTFYLSGNYYYIPMGEVAQRWNVDEHQINKERLEKQYHFIPRNWDDNLFSSKIKELNIRYILVCKGQFKITSSGYDPMEEYDKLQKCLNESRASLIYTSNKASIYEVPSGL
jgi:hypothetical protein